MIKAIRKISVRRRMIIISVFVSVLFFLFTTPIISWIAAISTPPNELQNIKVLATPNSLKLSWDQPAEIDIKSITINIGDQSYELDAKEITFTKGLDGSIPKSIEFITKDNLGITTSQKLDLPELGNETQLVDLIFNESKDDVKANAIVLSRSIFLGIIVFLGTLVVLGFDLRSVKSKVLSFYPAAVVIPYLLITYTFLISENYEINKFIFSFVFTSIFYVITYFVVLTTNILNTSINIKIPLEQAARASQFIFSLISSYFILILFFGAAFSFFEKILFIVPPIFYLTFSAILMLENVSPSKAVIRSFGITLTLIYGIFVLSIWPISYVYAILTIAVCFYILLSVALEIRSKVSNFVWIEYSVLILLVIFLLISNSSWGINGTLI